jgi:hypothetical protein
LFMDPRRNLRTTKSAFGQPPPSLLWERPPGRDLVCPL